jgi:hypothetical protein
VRSTIVKPRSGRSMRPKFVPISEPLTLPSAFFVNSSSMSTSIVAMRGRPTQRPASASATPAAT